MKAIDSLFHKIINGASQFVIPVFQRDYSWTESDCEQLWADILRVGRPVQSHGHFMGSLVYSVAGDTSAALTRWLLIDGQQRMTTLTLLVLALRNHIKQTGWSGTDEGPKANRLEAYFLKNVQEDGARQYKLVLRRNDNTALRALLDGEDPPPGTSSRVIENYEHFLELVASEDPEVVYRGINRLVVVDCKLDAHDDPQMVFESLNSTGVDLSQADLIRNFILMRLPEAEQTRLYDAHWRHIEELFRGESKAFDAFARDYLALRTRATRQARVADIYAEFRDFFRTQMEAHGIEAALAEMRRYARYYAAFILKPDIIPQVSAGLARLSRHADVAAILVMRLLDQWEREKTLTEAQLRDALELLESYAFRRSVCGLQTRGYWTLFAGLANQLEGAAPLDQLRALLHGQREGNRFPRDDEFEADLQRRDIYNMRSCHYLLERLENHGSKEQTNIDGLTIEHVMPQNEKLKKEWRDMLGPKWEEIHTTWVHRLGNLTLTGYNSEYQDRPFEEKKTISKGFVESALRLNRFIREQPRWSDVEMEKRGTELAKKALTVWKPLVVTDAMLRTSKQEELRRRAADRDADNVPMTDEARALFAAIRPRLRALHPDVIEVAEANSIVYYAPDGDYFVELLPRKYRLILLLDLEPNECVVRDQFVRSASDRKFLVHASQDGGTLYRLRNLAQVEVAMKLARQAFELAAQ